ncbi:MAG: hypothetical protein HKO07_00980 [Pseudomonadales bacterium]|nr:hypothetical protein [Pseudomonadales bacterium]
MTGKLALIAGVLLITSTVACSYGAPSGSLSQQSQQRWQRASLHNYSYTMQRSCYCTDDYTRAMRVRVRGGQVIDALYVDDGQHVPDKVLQSLQTIDQWFAYIDAGLRKPYFKLDADYHPQLGYPLSIRADIRQQVADDELDVRIWSLLQAGAD